jgi:parallel beta-helix repeat protein
MKQRFVKLAVPVTVTLIVVTSYFVGAGDLNPPGGTITGTMKPLSEVEPRVAINATNTPGDADSLYRITQAGSYYLTGNITGVVGKHGIEIAAGGVRLDLTGFELAGVAGSLNGVSAVGAGLTDIAVAGGSVRSWGGHGIDVGIAFNTRLSDLLASGNGGNGINAGTNAIVTGCNVLSNGGEGIDAAANSIFSLCAARENNGDGFQTGSGSKITDCISRQNAGDGFNIGNGGAVSGCSAYQNTGAGVSATNGVTIIDCTARLNTTDGISCASACVIRGNTCSNNGVGDGAGIHATGGDNRIEENNCTGADRGIDVDAAGNFIIRNTCAGNTSDWEIASNNVFGAIVDRRAPGAFGASGFSAASTLGTTEPDANFSY